MILMNDFNAESSQLRDAMLDAVRRVFDSGWYILGQEVLTFEKRWADFCGVKYGIGVGNGMDALEISLRVLDIGPGDEVITTPMTAFATVLAIIRAGAIPVLADINPETALMSLESAKRCLSLKTKAIVLVHLYGQIRDMGQWTEFCRENKISLIEDCAQAHSASWDGQIAGSFGDIGAYSFYPTKNLGAIGDAGMVVTNDFNLAERARSMRNYGQAERYYHHIVGLNSRLDEIHAAILLEKMNFLSEYTSRRCCIASIYKSHITNTKIQHMADPQDEKSHVYHLFVIKCKERDILQEKLTASSIQSLIHYPVPIHKQKPCLSIKRDPLGLVHSELHASRCLTLPCHPQISDREVAIVVEAVNAFKGA